MHGLTISAVERESAWTALGVDAGDSLVAIDDLAPRDVIDLQLELPGARSIVVERPDRPRRTLRIDGQLDPAAISLADPVPGGIRECNNHCEFCFIRGL